MFVFVNGERFEFDRGVTLEKIIEFLSIKDKVMAAAVNSNVVKKSEWSEFILNDDDKIELLQFVGGG